MNSRPEERTGGPEQPAEGGRSYNLLFVCTGNTCRSPMAAGLAAAAVAARGWANVAVRSAGVSTAGGSRATDEAVRAAAAVGVDLGDHRSQPLTEALVEWADRIVVMSPWHLLRVEELGGGTRVSLAAEFLGDDGPVGIPDPIGGDDEVYRATLETLSCVVDGLLDHLEPILAP